MRTASPTPSRSPFPRWLGLSLVTLALACAPSDPLPADGNGGGNGNGNGNGGGNGNGNGGGNGATDESGGDDDALSDPLSMPAVPTVALDNFGTSSTCGGCHPQHFAQWQTSMHAYAMTDPVYRGLVALRQQAFDGAQDRFCLQCHSPIGTRSGDVFPGFDFEDLSATSLEGINCETCHRASSVERTHTAGLLIDDLGPIRGPLASVIPGAAHESEYSPIFESSEFCASCHDVIEVNGLHLERPYGEWETSPAADDGQTCQSCHMPAVEGPVSVLSESSVVHEHYFVGVDLPLTDDFVSPEVLDEMRERTEALLADAATITLEASPSVAAGAPLSVDVRVHNNISGHNFPTGGTFTREVWVHLTAVDANGNVLFETGDLDANGDLRGPFSELDPYGDIHLIGFGSHLVDDGEPPLPLRLTWEAANHLINSLPPLQESTATLSIPVPAGTVGPITIDAALQFRGFGPHLLRLVGLFDEVERLEIHEVDSTTLDVDVSG